MPYSVVTLNSNNFWCVPFERGGKSRIIHRENPDPFPEIFRTEAQQRQGQILRRSSTIFRDFQKGFGYNRSSDDVVTGFWDSNGETRWGRFELPILATDNTEFTTSVTAEVLRAVTKTSGVTRVGLWEGDTSHDVLSSTISVATWSDSQNVAAGASDRVGLDIKLHKGVLVALAAVEDDHVAYRSTNIATPSWSAATTPITAALLSSNVSEHDDTRYGKLVISGEFIVAVIWDQDNDAITMFTSTDSGDNWTDTTVDIPVDGEVRAAVAYRGTDGVEKIYILTGEGLWEVDASDATPTNWTFRQVFADVNGGEMIVHDGQVFFSAFNAVTEPAQLFSMDTSSGAYVFRTNLGLDQNDGVPEDMLGRITAIHCEGPWLVIAVGGGGSGLFARILARKKFDDNNGWHNLYKHGTEALPIEILFTSGTRLHFGVRTATSTTDTQSLSPAFNDARTTTTAIVHTTTAYLDLPRHDGGLPTIESRFLSVVTETEDLGAATTEDYFGVSHGIDGVARTTTDLGDIDSSTAKLQYGSGAGESGKSDAIRVTAERDDSVTTQTPILNALELRYQKKPDVLERWVVLVDIQKTATESALSEEAVISNLESARDLSTLPAFTYGNVGTKYVDVRLDFDEDFQEGGEIGSDSLSKRTGFVIVTLEELD